MFRCYICGEKFGENMGQYYCGSRCRVNANRAINSILDINRFASYIIRAKLFNIRMKIGEATERGCIPSDPLFLRDFFWYKNATDRLRKRIEQEALEDLFTVDDLISWHSKIYAGYVTPKKTLTTLQRVEMERDKQEEL